MNIVDVDSVNVDSTKLDSANVNSAEMSTVFTNQPSTSASKTSTDNKTLIITPKPITCSAKRLMAFDYGTQKMGVAFGQSITGTATPLPLQPMRDGIANWQQLEQVIKQWQPEAFLVGLPLNMDSTESELSRRARKFARRLKHNTNLPVWMVDERLTTREARQQLQHVGQQRKGKTPTADSIAAVMMLESWFFEAYGVTP